MRNRVGFAALALVLFSAGQALALDNFELQNLSGLNDERVNTMLRTVAVGADHRAYGPATPLGLLGFDVGVSMTAISVPKEFETALQIAANTGASSIPSLIPVPKLSIHKGLPGGIDVGFSYATSSLVGGQEGLFSLWGLDAKWAFLSGTGPMPAAAVRFSMSSSDLWFLDAKTYAIDAIVSKNLFLIDPYLGAGLKYWSGSLQIPVALQGQTLTFESSKSAMNPHVFVGLPIKLAILRTTFELDYNLAGQTTYGAKVSLAF